MKYLVNRKVPPFMEPYGGTRRLMRMRMGQKRNLTNEGEKMKIKYFFFSNLHHRCKIAKLQIKRSKTKGSKSLIMKLKLIY